MSSNLAVKLLAHESGRDLFLSDVLNGLNASRKTLDPKYFYDEVGSRLFGQITQLPEYYITRTETRLLEQISSEIGDACMDTQAIVEFGSGSGRRSDILLAALPQATTYVPIDVSEELLESTARVVEAAHPNIHVQSLVADFTADMKLPAKTPAHRLGYFPGSTIGNFQPMDAVSFLARAGSLLGPKARMLVGVDLTKSSDKLEPAYNDSAGVTAAFNINVLHRINQELGGNFVLSNFAHQAFFDRDRSRIEMHLLSLENQQVTIDGEHLIEFYAGETIHTENSYKYTVESFRELAHRAKWQPTECWLDDDGLFSLHLLENAQLKVNSV